MHNVDKNRAIVAFLMTCPIIQENPLFFNFAEEIDGNIHIITNSDTKKTQYIDGSVLKNYTFTIACYKSVAYNPLGDDESTEFDENIEDMAMVQELLDWVDAQANLYSYPDFGDDYIIEKMRTLSTDPRVGIDTSTNPPLARYSFGVEIEYLDNTKKLWTD